MKTGESTYFVAVLLAIGFGLIGLMVHATMRPTPFETACERIGGVTMQTIRGRNICVRSSALQPTI